MKFKFCGDLDCPDWVLAEIVTISKITSVKLKLLCAEVVKGIFGENIDYAKVQKLTSDAKYELADIKGSIATLHFIFTNATKYRVDGDSLSDELQQLGCPKEHATTLCKSYMDNRQSILNVLMSQSLRLSHLEAIDWRVDYNIGSSSVQTLNEPSVRLALKIRNTDKEALELVAFHMRPEQLRLLLHELKQAAKIIDSLAT